MIYSEVRTTAREDFGIADTGSLMRRIRVVEAAYLTEVNRQRAIARASN